MRYFPLITVLVVIGCGGEPTKPSATTTAVTVTLPSPLIATKTAQASATASMSDGQATPVTTGWRSDVPTIATVTETGLVTGLTNGSANIYVLSGGRQGTATLRVVPNYQGQWRGSYVVRSCTQSGVFTQSNFCGSTPANTVLPTSMTLTQNGAAISGQFFLGTLSFTPFTGPVEGDGSVAFTGASTSGSSISIDVSWRINAALDGRLTGRHTQVWRATGLSGEGRIESDIVDWLNRTSSQTAPAPFVGPMSFGSLKDALRAVSQPQ